VGLPHV